MCEGWPEHAQFAYPLIPLHTCGLFHCYIWTSSFDILGVSGLFRRFYSIFLRKILLANNVDPDQTPHDVASDLGLHCLSVNLFTDWLMGGVYDLLSHFLYIFRYTKWLFLRRPCQ